MTDIEKIRYEVKRRIDLFKEEKRKADSKSSRLSIGARIAMLEEVLVLIDSISGEQTDNDFVCKDLNENGTCHHCWTKYGRIILCKNVICSRRNNQPSDQQICEVPFECIPVALNTEPGKNEYQIRAVVTEETLTKIMKTRLIKMA